LDGHVDEVAQLGERDDAVELSLHLLAGEAEQRAVEIDVVASRELGIEACPELDHRADAALDQDLALAGHQHAGDGLEQRALPAAIVADERDGFTRIDGERHVAQRPERLRGPEMAEAVDHRFLQRADLLAVEPVAHPGVADVDLAVRHRQWMCRGASRLKTVKPTNSATRAAAEAT